MMIDYSRYYWCRDGGHVVSRGEASFNKNGNPVCLLHHGRRLRTKPVQSVKINRATRRRQRQ